jgi:carbonic anhydrase
MRLHSPVLVLMFLAGSFSPASLAFADDKPAPATVIDRIEHNAVAALAKGDAPSDSIAVPTHSPKHAKQAGSATAKAARAAHATKPASAASTASAAKPAKATKAAKTTVSAAHVAAAAKPAAAKPAAAPKPAPAAPARAAAAPAPEPAAATAAPAAPAARHTADTPDAVWADLLEGNKRFSSGQARPHPFVTDRTYEGLDARPRAIVLACSESRVSPELVFDEPLGGFDVVRTAGNLVDPGTLGSIEYAVEHRHVKVLVVLGHVGCGPVAAAAAGGDLPSPNQKAIVDRIRPTVQRLSACFEGDELAERSVIANARQGATDALAGSDLLRTAVAKGALRVVAAVYDPRVGVVTPVSVPVPAATAQSAAR